VNLIYAQAVIETLGERTPEALTAVEEALKAGYPFSAIASDPDLKPLQGEARLKELAATSRPK
jgi:hypothetical protein